MGAKDNRSSSSASASSSSSSPQSTITIFSRSPPRSVDGYYLECRKDAQCVCSMCKASMTATLDLLPNPRLAAITRKPSHSPLRSNDSNKENQPWPPPFCVSSPMPRNGSRKQRNGAVSSRISCASESDLNLSLRFHNAKRIIGRLLILLCFLVLGLGTIWPLPLPIVGDPRLSYESFAQISQGSLARRRLTDRLDFVQRHISRAARGSSVSNCTGIGSVWRLEEEGYFIHSSCNMYSSPVEKVSVWGYGEKTSGILGRSFVDRSFTILSGKVLEWREGGIEHIIHPEGSSWTMPRWAASTILLDGDTWVLEYRRTTLSQGFGGFRGLLYLITRRLSSIWRNIKHLNDRAFFVRKHAVDAFGRTRTSRASIPRPT